MHVYKLNVVRTVALLSIAGMLVLGSVQGGQPPRSAIPKQVAYPHYLRFKVLEVTPVEQMEMVTFRHWPSCRNSRISMPIVARISFRWRRWAKCRN